MTNFIWTCLLCRLLVAHNHNFGQILTFGGSCTDHLLPMTAKFGALEQTMVYAYVPNFVSIGLFCRPLAAKTRANFIFFLDFGILWCRQLAEIWGRWTWVCSYKPSPIQRHQNRFCSPTHSWRNQAHKLWHSKVWEKTDKQKTQRFWPPQRRVKSKTHQTWQGDRGPRARSCTSKTFGVQRIVSALGGAENLGIRSP